VVSLLAHPETSLDKIFLNYDSEGASHFGGGEQQANDQGGEWTVKTAKKPAKPEQREKQAAKVSNERRKEEKRER
jgi:hypothetical protein